MKTVSRKKSTIFFYLVSFGFKGEFEIRDKPFISVIINCYNAEKYLQNSIDSVYQQSYKNWELILWDNASTDLTPEIAKTYDNRLHYFRSSKTRPLGEARDFASRKAQGKFLAFLDADDYWSEDKLEKQVALFLENSNLGFVYGRTKLIFEKKTKKNRTLLEEACLPEGDIFYLLATSNFVVFSSLMVDKKLFFECGGFPTHFVNSTDYFVLMRLAKKHKCKAVQEICCFYRIHDNNLSRKQRIISAKEALNVLFSFKSDQKLEEAIKNHYADLALIYIRENKLISSISLLIEKKCLFQFGQLIFRKIRGL